MPRSDLLDLATRYAAAWSSQTPERLAAFYAVEGVLVINGGPPSRGREAIAARARAFMQAYPDMVVRCDSVTGDATRAVFHWTWTGTNTGPGGTGAAVHLQGHEAWTLTAQGEIAESQGHFDAAEYERQLQAGPAPSP